MCHILIFILPESKGWRHYNWLDSFNVAVFKLSWGTAHGVLNGQHKIGVKIRWGHGVNYDQKTEGVYNFR